MPPTRTPAGGRRQRPAKPPADTGEDDKRCRAACRTCHVKHRILRDVIERSDCLRQHRRVAERTPAWPGRFRRLTVRYARRADTHPAFHRLGCSPIRRRRLAKTS